MTADAVTIRAATAHDASGILACLAAAFAPFRAQYSPEAYADTTLTEETIQGRLEAMAVLLAESRGTILGTVAAGVVSPEEGHIRGMAVMPGAQGQGVAGRLLQEAESLLRARGCKCVTLDTTAPLQRAIRFYEKNGYRATGRVTSFFGMPLYEYEKKL